MAISVNSSLPTSYRLYYIDAKSKEPTPLKIEELFSGTYVIVGVPAAFSPACSEHHIPSYIDQLKAFSAKSVRIIVVNRDNLFAQRAWAKTFGVEDHQDQIIFASDVGLKFITELDLTTIEVEPLGEVSSRFALIAKDGVVAYVGQEKTVGDVTVSSAETVLKSL